MLGIQGRKRLNHSFFPQKANLLFDKRGCYLKPPNTPLADLAGSGTYLVKYRPERRVGSRFTADLTSCAGHSLVYVTKPDYSARTSSDTVLRTRATPTIRRPTPPTRARCAPLPCYRAPLTVPARAAREACVRRTLPQQFRTVRPRHAVHATSQQGSISRDLFGG